MTPDYQPSFDLASEFIGVQATLIISGRSSIKGSIWFPAPPNLSNQTMGVRNSAFLVFDLRNQA